MAAAATSNAVPVSASASALLDVPQAYRSPYNEAIAPPNAPLSLAVCPALADPPSSKRVGDIEQAESTLDRELQDVTRAAHDDRQHIQDQLLEVHSHGRALEQRISDEYVAMEDTMNDLQHQFQAMFQAAFVSMEQQTLSHFARVETTAIAAQEKAIRECELSARQFYDVVVPEILERQQGSITRKLEKNHESFDIENAKTRKRECQLVAVLAQQEQDTQHHFALERDRRVTKFLEREDENHHVMRVDNRASERMQCQQIELLASLQQQLQEEANTRGNEDRTILTRVGAAFHRLQASILENLGDGSSE